MNAAVQGGCWVPRRVLTGLAAGMLLFSLWSAAGRAQETAAPDDSDDAKRTIERLEAVHKRAIRIEFGELGGGTNHCDVTAVLREQCSMRDRCDIEVSKTLCTTRQMAGLVQSLRVGYTCRIGELIRYVTAESGRLRLVCGHPPAPPD